jgi:hypothetical protein
MSDVEIWQALTMAQTKIRELEAELLVWKPKAPEGYKAKLADRRMCDGCAFEHEPCSLSTHITSGFDCDNIIFIKEQKGELHENHQSIV